MAEQLLSDKLLATPIFQGTSRADLHEIMGYIKFDFARHAANKTIIKAGTQCNKLLFLLNGTLSMTRQADGGAYAITELINAPAQIEVDRLFGYNTLYTASYRTVNDCNTMTITKREVIGLYNHYEVIRMNLINQFAARLHKNEGKMWTSRKMALTGRVAQFILNRCAHPAGEKWIKIRMNDLANELNDSRLDVSRALNALQAEGLLELSRGMIHVAAAEKLSSAL